MKSVKRLTCILLILAILLCCLPALAASPTAITFSFNQSSLTLERFASYQINPLVSPSGADKDFVWSTSQPSVASVSTGGLVSAVGPGTAVITCTAKGNSSVKNTLTVTVEEKAAPTSIYLRPATDVMNAGATLKLTAVPYPVGCSGYFTWSSSSTAIATVASDGTVTALKTGRVTITCTSRQNTRIKASRTILVVSADSPRQLAFDKPALTLNPGGGYALTMTAYPQGKSNAVRFTSSKPGIVSVDANGILYARRLGTAVITATSTVNSNVSVSMNVKVENLPAPTSLSVSGFNSVNKGKTIQLNAVTVPENAANQVTWTSSNKYIAVISSKGVVRGVRGGTAVITATSKANPNIKTTYNVSVIDPYSPTGIALNTASLTIEAGSTYTLVPSYSPSGCNTGSRFSSSSTTVAAVNSSGTITGKVPGTAIITVASSYNPTISKSIQVNVINKPAPSTITLSGARAMAVGDSLTLTTTVVPANASGLVDYTSSNTAVATVSDTGVVCAKKVGTVTITAYSRKNTAIKSSVTLTVSSVIYPTSLTLTESTMYLGTGDSRQLTFNVSPSNASRSVTYTSSNTAVATVSSTGVISAKASGIAYITCKSAVANVSSQCMVSVFSTERTTLIPARTTDIAGIPANMAKIEAIRRSTEDEIDALQKTGTITAAEAALRIQIIDNAFSMQAFPWMTLSTQEYWSKSYAYKRYLPDIVYYGLPYIQTSSKNTYVNRRYNVDKALNEGRWYSSGRGYYLLNQSNLLENMYVGNDCSAFVSMSTWGLNHSASFLNTTAIASSSYYNTLSGYSALRPGDIMVKSGSHVIMFLYYTDTTKKNMMIIEQGGDGSTVICSVFPVSKYSTNGYVPRRRTGFATK